MRTNSLSLSEPNYPCIDYSSIQGCEDLVDHGFNNRAEVQAKSLDLTIGDGVKGAFRHEQVDCIFLPAMGPSSNSDAKLGHDIKLTAALGPVELTSHTI